MRILVVEDDPAVSKVLQTALTRAGYDVKVARNGLEGLLEIDQGRIQPDLVICDIMMPELDGLTLVRALRSRPETEDLPIVFLTAKQDKKTVAEGISVGAKYFLVKPFSVDDLLLKVARALAR